MRGTKEFYEMQSQFEKSLKQSSLYVTDFSKPSKDEKNPNHVFYNNGETNKMFHVYMMGYGDGKLTERMGV